MSGNVWEWVWDWYGDYPPEQVKDPTGPPTGSRRVLRGGSWFTLVRGVRVARRFKGAVGSRDHRLGFRIARTLP
jgi:formylglycine-generating enzyme